MTLSKTLRAALELQRRTLAERQLPSGGWTHWWARAVEAGIFTADEARRYEGIPHATLERIEFEIADE